jgi:hypothetical protein
MRGGPKAKCSTFTLRAVAPSRASYDRKLSPSWRKAS